MTETGRDVVHRDRLNHGAPQASVTIYALTSREGHVFYVGQTVEPLARLVAHISEARGAFASGTATAKDLQVCEWFGMGVWVSAEVLGAAAEELLATIRSTGELGSFLRVLDVVEAGDASLREAQWTAYLFRQGHRLTNRKLEFSGGLQDLVDWRPDDEVVRCDVGEVGLGTEIA